MLIVDANHKSELMLGYQGESERTCVQFNLEAIAQEYPGGTVTLLVKRPGDTNPYPVLLVQDGDIYSWYIGVADTSFDGDGECQLTYQVGTVIVKTHKWPTHILESMTGATVDPPDPWESFVEDVLAAADEVMEAVRTVPETINAALEEAKESGEFDGVGIASIRMNEDYTLTITLTDGSHYDTDPVRGPKGDKGDTGNGIATIALNPDYTLTITYTNGQSVTTDPIRGEKGDKGDKGDTGNGIANIVLNADYTLTINYTDGTHITTDPIRGAKGDKGDKGDTGSTPDISIGTVETLAPGSQATASMSGTPEHPVLNLGIPEGQKGDKGEQGEVTLAELMTRAPVIIGNASGNMATFADGADDMPLKSLVVEVLPQQSGSGTPSPDNIRPFVQMTGFNCFRKGKNLLQNKLASGSAYGITWTVNADGSVALSGTAESDPRTPGFMSIDINTRLVGDRQVVGYGSVVLACSGRASYNPVSLIPDLVFQNDIYVDGVYKRTIQSNSPTGALTGGVISIGASRLKINEGTVIPAGTVYYPQIEIIRDASVYSVTDYEPFAGSVYPVTWQDGVYGVEIDVISGKGRIVWADVTLPNSFALFNSGTGTGKYTVFSVSKLVDYDLYRVDVYAEAGTGVSRWNRGAAWAFFSTEQGGLGVFVPSDSTPESVAAAIGGTKAVVRLAEPIEFEIDPVAIRTLFGDNVIFTDAGNVSVKAPLDTKLYIDRLTKSDTDMIADADIPSGKYFSVNNRLFLSTAAIARGSAVVPYSNCVETSIAEALNNLNS